MSTSETQPEIVGFRLSPQQEPVLDSSAAAAIVQCAASSAVVADRDLPQLAAAKAAVEGLARWTAETTPGARILVARSPRMRTDLANTPGARLTAAAPEAVAAAILERLAEDDPAPGLAILQPDPVEVYG